MVNVRSKAVGVLVALGEFLVLDLLVAGWVHSFVVVVYSRPCVVLNLARHGYMFAIFCKRKQSYTQSSAVKGWECVVCGLTVAKHQAADAQNQKPRHESPRATDHVGLPVHRWHLHDYALTNEQADYQPTRAHMRPHEKIILHTVQALYTLYSTGTEQLLCTVHLCIHLHAGG